MKRITGVTIHKGEILTVESDIFRCRCIKDLLYMEPLFISTGLISTLPSAPTTKSWVKGNVYDYCIDIQSIALTSIGPHIINPYAVFITEHDSNNITKDVFDEHFIDAEEYRDNQIDDITDGLK